MSTEQVIAILGVATGLVGGFGGPYFAHKRLGRTLAAERRKELIDQRRKLLDQGAVLLVELDEALAGLRDDSSEAFARDWADFGRTFAPFRARLDLWFDEGSEVVTAFERVVNEITNSRTFVAGQDGANRDLLEAMTKELQKSQMNETEIAETKDQMAEITQRRHELRVEVADKIADARMAFLRAARTYLAGDEPA